MHPCGSTRPQHLGFTELNSPGKGSAEYSRVNVGKILQGFTKNTVDIQERGDIWIFTQPESFNVEMNRNLIERNRIANINLPSQIAQKFAACDPISARGVPFGFQGYS